MSEENQETIKFTEEEMKSLVELQNRYQQSLLKLGQHKLKGFMFVEEVQEQEKILQEEEKQLKEEYLSVQKDEDALLKALTEKYGEGSLDAKTGTFTPTKSK